MSSPSPLAFSSVRFQYEPGGWALSVPDVSLGQDSICGLIGPNGSGKSTLLQLASGLLAPCSGHVRLDGRPLVRMSRKALARRVGYLPQECPTLFDYSVEQVAAMGRHAHGGVLDLSEPGDIGAVSRALDAVQMETHRRRPLSRLSGGERRRAWLAAALAQEPEILLLDEPTQALDPHQAATVMDVLARKAAEGLRVVAVLHDLNLAALFCHRLILVQDGAIVADGRPDEILNPELLHAAYGPRMDVIRHPQTLQPVVLPRR